MHEGQEGPAQGSGAPEGARRRDGRSADSALPAAGAVARAHATVSGWSRGRKLLAVGSAVGGAGLILVGVLTSGPSGQTALADSPVTTYADRIQTASDSGVSSPRPSDAASADPRTDRKDDGAPRDAERTAPGGTNPSEPGAPGSPGSPGPSNPGTSDPGTGTPGTDPGTGTPGTDPGTGSPGTGTPGTGTPGTDPGTGTPGTGTPGTGTPGTGSPGTSDPGPTTPPAPKPLAFAGLQKNFTVNLLGIKVLGSYTLSLTGQPGATASVTYGGKGAGSVTFGSDGRGSITLGAALIDLGLSNPSIRVAYSDGTAGAAIEAARNSL